MDQRAQRTAFEFNDPTNKPVDQVMLLCLVGEEAENLCAMLFKGRLSTVQVNTAMIVFGYEHAFIRQRMSQRLF